MGRHLVKPGVEVHHGNGDLAIAPWKPLVAMTALHAQLRVSVTGGLKEAYRGIPKLVTVFRLGTPLLKGPRLSNRRRGNRFVTLIWALLT